MRLVYVIALAMVAASVAPVRGANFCDLIRCDQEREPVCASNGVSFDNACLFQVAKCNNETLTIAAIGKCGDAATPARAITVAPVTACRRTCLDEFKPVCGSNGKTYSNSCRFGEAKCLAGATLTLASEGACAVSLEADTVVRPPPKNCPTYCLAVIQPVCGADGAMYNNACEFLRANCKIKNANLNYTTGGCAPASK